jgi:hypothetical protein
MALRPAAEFGMVAGFVLRGGRALQMVGRDELEFFHNPERDGKRSGPRRFYQVKHFGKDRMATPPRRLARKEQDVKLEYTISTTVTACRNRIAEAEFIGWKELAESWRKTLEKRLQATNKQKRMERHD